MRGTGSAMAQALEPQMGGLTRPLSDVLIAPDGPLRVVAARVAPGRAAPGRYAPGRVAVLPPPPSPRSVFGQRPLKKKPGRPGPERAAPGRNAPGRVGLLRTQLSRVFCFWCLQKNATILSIIMSPLLPAAKTGCQNISGARARDARPKIGRHGRFQALFLCEHN